MSYKSDVAVSTTVEGYNLLKDFCDDNQIHQKVYQLVGNNIHPQIEEIDVKSNSVIFGWNRIKWDESFPEYSQIREALEYLDRERIPWEFLRIGEDDDDVERKSGLYDLPPKGLKQEIVPFYNYSSDTSSYSKSINAIDEAVAWMARLLKKYAHGHDIETAIYDPRSESQAII